jgi:anti-sigma28 factor (negative regulator of flagellin synthesis)
MEAQDFNTASVQAFIAEQVEKTKTDYEHSAERREKIENLKAMIRANIYDVSSEKIAERLVEVLSRNVRIKLL